jgi:hypothetical protein
MTIEQIKAQIELKTAKKKVEELEISALKAELLELEWPLMKWSDLEKYLKEHPQEDYRNNPAVMSKRGFDYSYCRIITEGEHAGEMQIGAYYHYDHFSRGEDIRVAHDFRRYR